MHTTLAMIKQDHFKVKVSASKRRCSSDCFYILSTKDEDLFAFRHNKNSLWLYDGSQYRKKIIIEKMSRYIFLQFWLQHGENTLTNLIFYGNRIIIIQIGIKRTWTYIRVASNIHKDLITPHTRFAIRFWFVVFHWTKRVDSKFLVCPQILSTFHIDSFDDK